MVSVGISKLKVLADVVVEGNSTTNRQTNLLTHLSGSDPPTYLFKKGFFQASIFA